MKVFLSWSGTRSKLVADALKRWLPDILQFIDTWVSEHDIDAGVRWSQQLTNVLEETQIGIIIVTPENQTSTWLVFEAGALSKSVENSRVIPLLIDLKPIDLLTPLSQFQAVEASKSGIKKLLSTINKVSNTPIDDERMIRLIDLMFPDLETNLNHAITHKPHDKTSSTRTDREVLNEILSIVRSDSRRSNMSKKKHRHWDSRVIKIDSRSIFGEKGKYHRMNFLLMQMLQNF